MGENKVLYRNPTGMEQHTPVEVIAFEIGNLQNIDILDYCLAHYGQYMDKESRETIEKAITDMENDCMDEDKAKVVAESLVKALENVWGITIHHVTWLAEYDVVAELYSQFGSTPDILAVPTTDYILSDLGYDGILFAYPFGTVFA